VGRAVVIRRLAGIEWTDVQNYDVTVDPAAIGFDAAVNVVVRAVSGRSGGAAPDASVSGV
jgi:hypothetical protein